MIEIKPEPKKKRFSVNMTQQEHDAIVAAGQALGIKSFCEIVRVLGEAFVAGEFAKTELSRENTKRRKQQK